MTTCLAEQRRILDALPLDAWEVLTDCIMRCAIGNRYDEPVEHTPKGIHVHWQARNVQLLRWIESERFRLGLPVPSVLDVGCWQGKLIADLCQRGFQAGGTDLAEMSASVSDHVNLVSPYTRENFQGFSRGWAHEVLDGMAPGAWDIVVCAETLEHIPSSVLPATCDALLQAAKYSVLVEVPGWDDGSALHLRVFTVAELERLLVRTGWWMTVLQEPGDGVYTTVRMERECPTA